MFSDETTKVGVTDYAESFSIELEPGTKAVKQKIRPLTPVQAETLKKQLANWTADGIIAPSAIACVFPSRASHEEGWNSALGNRF